MGGCKRQLGLRLKDAVYDESPEGYQPGIGTDARDCGTMGWALIRFVITSTKFHASRDPTDQGPSFSRDQPKGQGYDLDSAGGPRQARVSLTHHQDCQHAPVYSSPETPRPPPISECWKYHWEVPRPPVPPRNEASTDDHRLSQILDKKR